MTRDPWLDRATERVGHWWLDDDPDQLMPGTLRYDPDDGLQLHLIGGFEHRIFRQFSSGVLAQQRGYRSWPVIRGLVDNNRKITLLDWVPGGTQMAGLPTPDSKLVRQKVIATTALVGAHVDGKDSNVFGSCIVTIENLNQWSDSSGITCSLEPFDPDGAVRVQPPGNPSATVNGTTVTLGHRYLHKDPEPSRGWTIGGVTETPCIHLRREEPISVGTARSLAKAMQDLISLATHEACAILSLQLKVASDPDQQVAVYFKDTVRGHAAARGAHRYEALFTCHDVPFEEVVHRWWEVRETFRAASSMVLGLRYAPARFVEGNLLTAVGAAEAMHRALKIDGPRMPEADFTKLRATLLDHTPEEHRAWVKSAIRNQPDLRDRLRALAGRPDQAAMAALVPNVERWADVATVARNSLAHEGHTPKHSLEELSTTVRVTTAVVLLNLLHALGISPERQREIVRDHPQLSYTADQAREILA